MISSKKYLAPGGDMTREVPGATALRASAARDVELRDGGTVTGDGLDRVFREVFAV